MAVPIRLQNVPEHLRYAVVPRPPPSSRAGDLMFPRSKIALWDHTSKGPSVQLHVSYYRRPKIYLATRVLRLAQRHAQTSKQAVYCCMLVGSLSVDEDGEGVTFKLDRFSPGGDQDDLSADAPGDILVPFQVHNNADVGALVMKEDFITATNQLLEQCSSKEAIEISNFLLTRGSYCIGQTHSVQFHMVTIKNQLKVTPITPVPIVPTALSKNLAGPMSLSQTQGTPKSGYLTMDHTRKLLLILESDPKAYNLPLVGIWVSGVPYIYHSYVWACCIRYLHNKCIQDRVCVPPDPFLLVLYSPLHSRPEFYECKCDVDDPGVDFDLYHIESPVNALKTDSGSEKYLLELDLSVCHDGQIRDMFEAVLYDYKDKRKLEVDANEKATDTHVGEDIVPRSIPRPVQSQMPAVEHMVPEVSLFFSDNEQSGLDTLPPRAVNPGQRFHRPSNSHNSQPFSGDAVSTQPQPPHMKHVTFNGASHMHEVPRAGPPQCIQQTRPSWFTGAPMQVNAPQTCERPQYQSSYHHANSAPLLRQPSAPMYRHPTQNRITHPAEMHQGYKPQGYPIPQNSAPLLEQYLPHSGQSMPQSHEINPSPSNIPFSQDQQQRQTYQNYNVTNNQMYQNGISASKPMYPSNFDQAYRETIPNGPQQAPWQNQLTAESNLRQPSVPTPSQVMNVRTHMPVAQSQPLALTQQVRYPYTGPTGPVALSQQERSLRPQGPIPVNLTKGSQQFTASPTILQQSNASVKICPSYFTADVAQSSVPSGHLVPSIETAQNDSAFAPASRLPHPQDALVDTTRMSQDSGLSVTPEKSLPGAEVQISQNEEGSSSSHGSSLGSASNIDWKQVPLEVCNLLQQQEAQLKDLQAQIKLLMENQSHAPHAPNSTAMPKGENVFNQDSNDSQRTVRRQHHDNFEAPGSPANIFVVRSNSPPKQGIGDSYSGAVISSPPRNKFQDVPPASSESTPAEIRHKGLALLDSTHRDDLDGIDVSHGDLTHLMNNIPIHEKTIDSVQSEMIVDMPSFQSSPTSGSQLYSDPDANGAIHSPLSVSMYDQPNENDSPPYGSDEEENILDSDQKEYYDQLINNIKKMLNKNNLENSFGQNATADDAYENGPESTVTEDTLSNIRGRLDLDSAEQLLSILQIDQSMGLANTTFIPKINYISMFLDSDVDTSMEINAMAMKYLKDEQLTHLSRLQKTSALNGGSRDRRSALLRQVLASDKQATPNVTLYGMSPCDMTIGTKKYMEKHGLFASNNETQTNRVHNDSSFSDMSLLTYSIPEAFNTPRHLRTVQKCKNNRQPRSPLAASEKATANISGKCTVAQELQKNLSPQVQNRALLRPRESESSPSPQIPSQPASKNLAQLHEKQIKDIGNGNHQDSSLQNGVDESHDMILDIARLRQLPKLL